MPSAKFKLVLKPGDLCDCANPATIIKGNAKMCQRCFDAERLRYNSGSAERQSEYSHRRHLRAYYALTVEVYRLHLPATG